MEPFMKSSNRTMWDAQQRKAAQPTGIDYRQLNQSLEKVEKNSKYVISKDLRKTSFNTNVNKEEDKDDEIQSLDRKSIIPVPGLAVSIDNNENDYSPPDNWNNPNNGTEINGPQWNPMTF